MNNYVDLPAPILYVPDYEPLYWAKKHCKSYITNNAVQKQGKYYYRYFFGNEKDIVMFMLKWS